MSPEVEKELNQSIVDGGYENQLQPKCDIFQDEKVPNKAKTAALTT